MVIDFHTHIFPDKIAERAVGKLADIVHQTPEFNGTAEGLRTSMRQAGVDLSLVLPVVTDVHQFDSILRFAVGINETFGGREDGRLLSVGGIHPDDAQYREHLIQIRREGLKGVKLHPNYQGVLFSDIRYKRILDAASEQGLFLITHAGYDPYTPEKEFCTADMILEVMREVAPEKLVLAHLGSLWNYREAEEKLCGGDFYMDTAASLGKLDPEDFVRMVRKHGADRILFASDCPWGPQREYAEYVEKCSLTPEEKERILSGNAGELLGAASQRNNP